jgi:hypothetical protein
VRRGHGVVQGFEVLLPHVAGCVGLIGNHLLVKLY